MYCQSCGRTLPVGTAICPNCRTRVPSSLVPPPPPGRKSSSGVGVVVGIVIGVFGFIVVVGIVAAIAIPNLITAIQRGKQKRTVSDLRSISAAIEAYRKDHGECPQANGMTDLVKLLVPTYAKILPVQDAWRHPFRYSRWQDGGTSRYVMGSAGKDGLWEKEDLTEYTGAPGTTFDSDIVLADGEFVQLPSARMAPAGATSPGVAMPSAALTFQNLNFSLQQPPSPWVQMDAKKLNPAAAVAFMRSNPQVFFFIIAEVTDREVDSDALVEVVKGNLKSAAPDAQFLEEKPYQVKGIDGTRIVSRATVNGVLLFYVHWVATTGRDAYQLITVGGAADQEAVRSESTVLLNEFGLLQPPAATVQPAGQ